MKKSKARLKTLLALASLAGVIAASCGLLEPSSRAWPPSFTETAGIMEKSCAACHRADTLDALITLVKGLYGLPGRLDSTPVSYGKRLILDGMEALSAKMNLYPQLDFRDSSSLNDYANNLAGKRDVLCQRLQFAYFRPYHPQGMPPPYAGALRNALEDSLPEYLSGFADPASRLGAWRSADSAEHLNLTLLPDGTLSHTFYTVGGFYRGDSAFAGAAQLIALVSMQGDTLLWDDRLSGRVYSFVKMTPGEALAGFVSDYNVGSQVNPVKWRELGIHALAQAQCVFCHNRDNFLSGSKYATSGAPLPAAVSRTLPAGGLRVNVLHHPLSVARQLKSLGYTLSLAPGTDFSSEKNIERFLNISGEAQDMADRLQTPLYHDWYPGGMPPPWAPEVLRAVDPGASFGFLPLDPDSRKAILAFLTARLGVNTFNFQGLPADEYACCDDAGVPFSGLSGYSTPAPCGLTPYFADEAADSLASAP